MEGFSESQNQISAFIQRACETANLPLLSTYWPGILGTFSVYQIIYAGIGPWLSTTFFPKAYPSLRGKKKLDWDENVVSLIQAIVLCAFAGQVVLSDEERQNMNWQERVWGYTKPAAMVLTIANGYFYWHTMMMIRHRDVFGWAMVAHGLAVSFLMTNGYRPAFLTYSTPSFLYEFSTIFLDIQSTLRALQMEGTTIQVLNGVAFAISFFLSRVAFGTYLQTWFYIDVWHAFVAKDAEIPLGHDRMPTWLLAAHVFAGITLQALNYWWFYKIGRTVRRKLFAKKIARE